MDILTAVAITALNTFILFIVYYYLFISQKRQYLLLWSLSWLFYAFRLLLTIVIIKTDNLILVLTHQFFTISSASFLLAGTYLYIGHNKNKKIMFVSIVFFLLAAFNIINNTPFILSTVPLFIFLGLVNIWTGICFFKYPLSRTKLTKILGILFIIWGLHKFDYPFLIHSKVLAPIGFFFASTLSLTVAILFLIIHYLEKQRELGELNRTLNMRVEQRAEELRKYDHNFFARSKFEILSEMITAIAHHWRQPINAIGLYVQNIEDTYKSGEMNIEYIKDYTKTNMALINKLSTTIDDFATFFSSENDKKVFNPAEIVTDTINLFYTSLSGHSIYIIDQFKDHQLKGENENILLNDMKSCIYGNPGEFKQVIINLVQNSKEAILGSINSNNIDKGEINLFTEYYDDIIRISVADNGGGIHSSHVDKIFSPYFSTKHGHSSGLGLYMSKIFIEENMNGKIFFENSSEGAKFTIEIPFA